MGQNGAVTILGALILAGGALFGIWLGAVYAAGRLGVQLEEQASRFDRQLEAEAKRLERQLEHDRRMRDRDELRKVLDEVAAGMFRTIEAIGAAHRLFPNLEDANDLAADSPGVSSERRQALGAANSAIYDLWKQLPRLRLRFGFDHPVTKGFEAMRQAFKDVVGDMEVDIEKWTPEHHEHVADLAKKTGRKHKVFIEACRKYTDVEAS